MLEKYNPNLLMLKINKIRCMAGGRRDKALPNKCETEKVQCLFFFFDKDLKIEKEIQKSLIISIFILYIFDRQNLIGMCKIHIGRSR